MNVTRWAIGSRCLLLTIALTSSLIVGPYDTSANLAFGNASKYFPTATNWDSQYFVQIAQSGYTHEHMHAFFPLVPILTRFIHLFSSVMFPSVVSFGYAFAAILFSNFCFILSASEMYHLSVKVFGRDAKEAKVATLLYIFNPASVFMSAAYTEACFAWFSFWAMRSLYDVESSMLLQFASASLPIFCACLTRSNGVILCGYIGYRALLPFLQGRYRLTLSALIRQLTVGGIACLLSGIVPLIFVLWYGFQKYCHDDTESPAWCRQKIPNIYSHVQKTYWNQGFLNYYQVKQIPNFLLAFPMAYICIQTARYYVGRGGNFKFQRNLHVLPFVVHMMFLFVFCMLFMHVQVLTRFVSACPCIFWYLAIAILHKSEKWSLMYHMVYFFVGTSMFACYYPWT